MNCAAISHPTIHQAVQEYVTNIILDTSESYSFWEWINVGNEDNIKWEEQGGNWTHYPDSECRQKVIKLGHDYLVWSRYTYLKKHRINLNMDVDEEKDACPWSNTLKAIILKGCPIIMASDGGVRVAEDQDEVTRSYDAVVLCLPKILKNETLADAKWTGMTMSR